MENTTSVSPSSNPEPILLTTVIQQQDENGVENDGEESSIHSIVHDFRSSPITFEDYFYKSSIQRKFITNVLMFQIIINLSAAFGSLICTFLTDELWFWKAGEDLLNALLLHTVFLSILMLLLPFFLYKIRKWNPTLQSKSVLEALIRLYQSCIFTFWFGFGMGKIWITQNKDTILNNNSKNYPLFFLPALYYVLSLINHIVIIIILRFTNVSIQNRSGICISFTVSIVFVFITLTLTFSCSLGRGFIIYDILQILAAAALSALEGSLILCSFKQHEQRD